MKTWIRICSFLVIFLLANVTTYSAEAQAQTITDNDEHFINLALSYAQNEYDVPSQNLTLLSHHPVTGTNVNYEFVALFDERGDGQVFKLFVNTTHSEVLTWTEFRRKEHEDIAQTYGKLHPTLWARLQSVADDEQLPIAIWLAQSPLSTYEELFATLATQFPEAQLALQSKGKPWLVADPILAQEIEATYRQLLQADTDQRLQPLLTYLAAHDIPATTYGSMPSVTVDLTKAQILALNEHPEVGLLYLIEQASQKMADNAILTDFVPPVWYQGVNGQGVTVAVIEQDEIDPTISCLDVADVRSLPGQSPDYHKSLVASLISCNDTTHTGVAPAAQLLDAVRGTSAQSSYVNALQWAISSPHTSTIVNFSEGFEEDNNVNWTDRAADYWARTEFALLIHAAGNSGGSLISPAKGWNMLSVGASNDHGTLGWSGDDMAIFSAYINPNGIHREKPELVAPGANIEAYGVGNALFTESGTSFAAPQVAGLAALLIDKNSAIQFWPEAMRAILMATATNNIVGVSDIPMPPPSGQDLEDGAGAINGSFAVETASVGYLNSDPCSVPCWWATATTGIPVGGALERFFDTDAGETVRVAISWWSNVDQSMMDYSSSLDTDLDLYIHYNNGGGWDFIDVSASVDNNYELLEFVAPNTGQYRIQVRKANVQNGETVNFVGIAFFKGDTACEPDAIPRVSISIVNDHLTFVWTSHSINSEPYALWESNDPYFAPGDTGSSATNTSGISHAILGAIGDPNDNHYYRLRPTNNCRHHTDSLPVGEFDFGIVPGDIPPVAPSNVQVMPLSTSTIKVTWTDNSDNEDGFTVFNGGTFFDVEEHITEFYETGLAPNTYRCYKVRAFNNAGTSPFTPDWVCTSTLP